MLLLIELKCNIKKILKKLYFYITLKYNKFKFYLRLFVKNKDSLKSGS